MIFFFFFCASATGKENKSKSGSGRPRRFPGASQPLRERTSRAGSLFCRARSGLLRRVLRLSARALDGARRLGRPCRAHGGNGHRDGAQPDRAGGSPCCCRLPNRSSKQLSHEIESYFAVAIYKVYRYLYMADPSGVDTVFRAPGSLQYLCDARMKEHELKIRLAANGEEGCGLTQENIRRMPLASKRDCTALSGLSSALLTVLQQVSRFDRPEK